MKKLILAFIAILVLSVSANAADSLRVIRSGDLVKTSAPSLTVVTLTGLIANVTTSSITVTTGNVNIPVTVNGVLLYIKANSNP